MDRRHAGKRRKYSLSSDDCDERRERSQRHHESSSHYPRRDKYKGHSQDFLDDVSTSSNISHRHGSRLSSRDSSPHRHSKRVQYHDLKTDSDQFKSDPAVLSEFSFSDYRRELNRIFFHDPSPILDVDDLWRFVAKYEGVQRKKKEPIFATCIKRKSINIVCFSCLLPPFS